MIFYIRTAKTASSTVNDWLGSNYSRNVTNNTRYLDHEYNKNKIEDAINKNYFIFTTVRHPYTRAISCWRQAIRTSWLHKNSTFDDYLDWNYQFGKVSISNNIHAITHNMPISEYLAPYLHKINLVVKYENFQEKLVQMQQLFEMPVRRFGHFNPTEIKVNYAELLTQERKDKIYHQYKADFEAFNYSKTIDF